MPSHGSGVTLLAEPQAFERRGDLIKKERHDLGKQRILVGVVVVKSRARHHRGGADVGDTDVRIWLGLARLEEARADRPTRLPDSQVEIFLGFAPVLI